MKRFISRLALITVLTIGGAGIGSIAGSHFPGLEYYFIAVAGVCGFLIGVFHVFES